MKLALFRSCFFYALLCLFSMASTAEEKNDAGALNALQYLESMSQSFSTLSYDGVFVHLENMKMNSMRICHRVINGVEYEKLEDLDGDKVEILRVDDRVLNKSPRVFSEGRSRVMPFKRFKNVDGDRLVQGYSLSLNEDMSRIAGRDVVSVTLMPKDDYRYGHTLWIDADNHFLLKHDMFASSGKVLERIQFTSVVFSSDLKASNFVLEHAESHEATPEINYRDIKSLWKFDWLPEGFDLVWSEARSLSHSTTMLLLSDGMATVSVFIEPVLKKHNMSLFNVGSTIVGERSIKVQDQRYLLTVVGEVPQKTIEKLMVVFMPRQNND